MKKVYLKNFKILNEVLNEVFQKTKILSPFKLNLDFSKYQKILQENGLIFLHDSFSIMLAIVKTNFGNVDIGAVVVNIFYTEEFLYQKVMVLTG